MHRVLCMYYTLCGIFGFVGVIIFHCVNLKFLPNYCFPLWLYKKILNKKSPGIKKIIRLLNF